MFLGEKSQAMDAVDVELGLGEAGCFARRVVAVPRPLAKKYPWDRCASTGRSHATMASSTASISSLCPSGNGMLPDEGLAIHPRHGDPAELGGPWRRRRLYPYLSRASQRAKRQGFGPALRSRLPRFPPPKELSSASSSPERSRGSRFSAGQGLRSRGDSFHAFR